ncbi:hypothetical protein K8352_01465 [Flavobacteriaceae bacterium F89]|uniref:Uncharacterized protein n=1 Tax=Cerina litoralis TaxID=2874477 RepID=A0AAE3ETQ1_9FLAO|nr:hypothetical protein [Cerina litoralis]MCG2459411.1 hypothetical protein [Cerina litoralis]
MSPPEFMAAVPIFDLDTLKILPHASEDGKVEAKISADDSEWDNVDLASNIARSALSRLIKRYKKYRIK